MAAPGIPSNFILQQGNGEVFLSWDITAGATSYLIQRSLDGVTYSALATVTGSPLAISYLDVAVTVGTQYYYRVASDNGATSPYTSAQTVVPTLTAQASLGQIRLQAQQRADRVNSNFVTTAEWNSYINQSYFELYDLLVTQYEDYFVNSPYQFQTDGVNQQYALPSNFYKLMGVDLGLDTTANAWVTIKKFNFIARNRYVYPNITSTFLGVFNLQYRLLGNTIELIPLPSAGQIVRLWYVPRLTQLLKDTDIMDGVSGWSEYVITDAAIKALQKEESDVSILGQQKMMLIKRIEDSAMNRDVGQPDTISATRSWGGRWSGPNGDSSSGGF